MFDVEYGLFDKSLNFVQNTDTLITLGNRNAKNKERTLECTVAYSNIGSRFPNHDFYINLVKLFRILTYTLSSFFSPPLTNSIS